MTSGVVRDTIRYFHELTEGMEDSSYLELLEELVLTLAAEHNALDDDDYDGICDD